MIFGSVDDPIDARLNRLLEATKARVQRGVERRSIDPNTVASRRQHGVLLGMNADTSIQGCPCNVRRIRHIACLIQLVEHSVLTPQAASLSAVLDAARCAVVSRAQDPIERHRRLLPRKRVGRGGYETNPRRGWVVGFLLIGLGALRSRVGTGLEPEDAPLGRLRQVLPYFPLVATALVAGYSGITGRSLGNVGVATP